MCPEVKKCDKPNAKDSVSAKKAELQAKLDRYLNGVKPLEEQKATYCLGHAPQPIAEEERAAKAARYEALQAQLYGTEVKARFANDHEKEPDELPAGIEKKDLRNRGVRYMGTDNYSDGKLVYLFTVSEADGKDWGTVLAVKPEEKGILHALDEKLAQRQQKREAV